MCEKRSGNERASKVWHTRRADERARLGRCVRIEVMTAENESQLYFLLREVSKNIAMTQKPQDIFRANALETSLQTPEKRRNRKHLGSRITYVRTVACPLRMILGGN